LADGARIAARLQALWEIASGPGGGADRPAFSEPEAEAMLLVAGWAREGGLEPGLDRHGNLWALPAGWEGPLVSAGSHVDTVPDGGRYDGGLGTVLGLELARDLHDGTPAGARPAVLVCAAEEAPRFGAGTVGSRLLVGTLAESALDAMHDRAGVSAASARAEYLRALTTLPRIESAPQRVITHVEVHVAPRRELRELGVVTRVASPRRLAIELLGQGGHAGEISMETRRDALAAAAELVLAIEAAARAEPLQTVATAADLTVSPGAVSVIPEKAVLAVDLRAIELASLDRLEGRIRAGAAAIAARRGVGATVKLTRGGEPVVLDERLARDALATADRLGIAARETWSGAGHDAQHLAALMPTLLLFVPLHGGESHTPAEGADMSEILDAARLAAEVLRTRRV
jgi:hydantoinase/carbamoylase family amidase